MVGATLYDVCTTNYVTCEMSNKFPILTKSKMILRSILGKERIIHAMQFLKTVTVPHMQKRHNIVGKISYVIKPCNFPNV